MHIFHLNIQCLRNKTLVFDHFLYNNFTENNLPLPDVICFTEHWLFQNEISFYKIDGYNISSYYCREDSIHGGLLTLVKDKLTVKDLIWTKNYCVEKHAEFSAIEVKGCNLIIVLLYRPPTGDMCIFLNNLTSILVFIFSFGKNIVVLGDFNVNFLKENQQTKDLLNLFNTFGLKQTIFEATRVTATTSSCIDNIFVNIPNFNSIVIKEHISDHYAQLLSIRQEVNLSTHLPTFYRSITTTNLNILSSYLHNESWRSVYDIKDPDLAFDNFLDTLNYYCDIALPLKKSRPNKNKSKKWFTPELSTIKNTLQLLYDVAKNTNNEANINNFNNYKKFYRNCLKTAKKQYNSNYINNCDNKSKAVWDVVKCELPTSRQKVETKFTAQEFNEYFTNVASNIIKDLPPSDTHFSDFLNSNNVASNRSLYLHPTDIVEIKSIINNFKIKKSTDIYGMNSNLLKHINELICYPLEYIFNLCLSEGIFPKKLKIAKVVPLQKKANIDSLDNFRPIALLPLLSKVFETIIKTRLVTYFEKNKLITDRQFGYRKGRSTSHAAMDAINFLLDAFEQGKYVSAIFCDLCKAFDCVSLQILLAKLNYYGVRGVCLKLLESYITDRFQVVIINNIRSTPLLNKYSVPQGSVLGPFLFLVYINDLPNICKQPEYVVLFVDDAKFLSSNFKKEDAILLSRHILANAEKWFISNTLKLNKDKTVEKIFHNRVKCDDEAVRFLGIYIDGNLTWSKHCNTIIQNISKSSFALRKLTPVVPFVTAKVAYHAMVGSHLTYGILLWGASAYASKVFIAQKKTVRILCGVKWNHTCKPLFIENQILTLPCMYIYHTLIYVKSNLNLFNMVNKYKDRESRFGNQLEILRVRLEVTKNSPKYWGPKFMNKLPDSIISENLTSFKRNIKTLLLDKAYYTIDEFLKDKF